MPTMKPATEDQLQRLAQALRMLRTARNYFALADCPATLAKVRSAIKSAEGAERHMARRRQHTKEAGGPRIHAIGRHEPYAYARCAEFSEGT